MMHSPLQQTGDYCNAKPGLLYWQQEIKEPHPVPRSRPFFAAAALHLHTAVIPDKT
jgi:hypothetical protein